MTSLYRRILPGWVVEDAVTDTIRTWISAYLAEIADQWDRPLLPEFRSYNVRPDGDRWTEEQMPSLIVVNTGLETAPRKSGDGEHEGTFRVGCVITVMAMDQDSTRKAMEDYTAAVRAILVQKHGLGIGATAVDWVAESYDETPAETGRTLAGGIVEFLVSVPSLVTSRAGPASATPPDLPPGAEWPKVEDTFLDVEATRTSEGG